MANWIESEGYESALIAKRIEKAKFVGSDGNTSFGGFEYRDHAAILTSMLNLNGAIPEVERRKIVNKAMFAAAAKGIVTPESILKQVVILESEYLRQPKERFRLITSISLALPSGPKVFGVNGSRISIGWRADKRSTEKRSQIVRSARRTIRGDLPSFYTAVAVSVTARSENEAATKALDDLDLLRGIWNLWENRHYTTRISSDATPVNKIILGPIHSLHRLNGDLVGDSWWYEPGYYGPVNVWRDASRVPKAFLFAKSFRSDLGKLPYREDITSALIRYTRALDLYDWNYAFLQLWSVLELLTGTTQNESHKTTVKRASFIFADTDYALQALLHLRANRNKSVHTGAEVENTETLMYQVKRAVEALFMFHIGRAGKFQKMADAAEFMDSPNNLATINRKIRQLQAVRKLLVHKVNSMQDMTPRSSG